MQIPSVILLLLIFLSYLLLLLLSICLSSLLLLLYQYLLSTLLLPGDLESGFCTSVCSGCVLSQEFKTGLNWKCIECVIILHDIFFMSVR